MGKVLLLLLLFGNGVATFAYPWIGVASGYVISVFGPQFVWPWVFAGTRPFLWVFVPTVLSWAFGCVSGKLKLESLKSRISLFYLIWWLATTNSFLFGPYIGVASGGGQLFDPKSVLISMTIQFGFMFIGMNCLTTAKQLRYLVSVVLYTTLYMTYWGNDQYLSGLMINRLSGPFDPVGGGALYLDSNTFAMLFVLGAPFVYYCGLYFRNWIIRYGLWLTIPLAWHAIFLTSSRGALLGVAVTLAIVTVRSRRVGVGLLILLLFGGAYYWQAGGQMKERAAGIDSYEEDRSASSRLEAWEAAITMTLRQPISGVGVAAFIPAFSSHSDYQPRATHNTYFEIYAESGIFAGTAWLLVIASIVTACLRTSRLTRRAPIEDDDARFLFLLSEAMLAAILGFFTCATFLSLKGYEVFFLLGLIAHVMDRCSRAYVPDKKVDARPGYGRQMPNSTAHERARAGGLNNSIYVR